MSLKRSVNLVSGAADGEDEVSDQAAATAVLSAELVARGVGSEFAARVARELALPLAALPPATYERALQGIVDAWESHGQRGAAAGSESVPPLRELQALMRSFVGELSKLDEALEVLAATLRRMRETAGGAAATGSLRILH